MLSLSAIVLLAGCGDKEVGNPSIEDTGDDIVVANENSENLENPEISEEVVDSNHPEWVATSLTLEDLERIEQSMPPLSYSYQTYDMQAETEVDSWVFTASEWDNTLYIPEYENMVNREVTSSGIEDDMIYTMSRITLQDGTILDVLYVNEPDTLFCRSISIKNGDLTTLYSNFVYAADVQ